MSQKKYSKLRQSSNNTNTNYSAIIKAQRRHEDLSQRPQTIILNDIINRSCLVRGLRNAGFEIDGAQTFGSFREAKMEIVFATRRHGKRALQAFQGGLAIPSVSKKVTAIPKCQYRGAAYSTALLLSHG